MSSGLEPTLKEQLKKKEKKRQLHSSKINAVSDNRFTARKLGETIQTTIRTPHSNQWPKQQKKENQKKKKKEKKVRMTSSRFIHHPSSIM
jgi:hypothetical protein